MLCAPSADLGLRFSRHAERRRTRRCKRNAPLQALVQHFDRDVDVGGGVWAWSVTEDHLADLVAAGVLRRREADALLNLVVLVAENDNEVVTVLRGQGRRIGRYYRRRS